jgi:hypothetical protein
MESSLGICKQSSTKACSKQEFKHKSGKSTAVDYELLEGSPDPKIWKLCISQLLGMVPQT